MRILAIADETDRSLTVERLRDLRPDLVLSCGDLGADYLDFISSAANASLIFVPGNHDPDMRRRPAKSRPESGFEDIWGEAGGDDGEDGGVGPPPGINADLRIVTVNGLTVAGLGGSVRYRPGPNQYTQRQMSARARRLAFQARLRRKAVDVLITHSPPQGMGDDGAGPHQGFAAFIPLLEKLQPRLMLHGHIHPHGFAKPDRRLGGTTIVNVIPHKVLELEL